METLPSDARRGGSLSGSTLHLHWRRFIFCYCWDSRDRRGHCHSRYFLAGRLADRGCVADRVDVLTAGTAPSRCPRRPKRIPHIHRPHPRSCGSYDRESAILTLAGSGLPRGHDARVHRAFADSTDDRRTLLAPSLGRHIRAADRLAQ
jgi:hypothetical protein